MKYVVILTVMMVISGCECGTPTAPGSALPMNAPCEFAGGVARVETLTTTAGSRTMYVCNDYSIDAR